MINCFRKYKTKVFIYESRTPENISEDEDALGRLKRLQNLPLQLHKLVDYIDLCIVHCKQRRIYGAVI